MQRPHAVILYRYIITWTSRISAPASARAIAMACPMPLVPPVTNAVFPSRENNCNVEPILLIRKLSLHASAVSQVWKKSRHLWTIHEQSNCNRASVITFIHQLPIHRGGLYCRCRRASNKDRRNIWEERVCMERSHNCI